MAFESATTGDHVELLTRLREILLGYPLVSDPVKSGAGNGTLHSIHTTSGTPVETWTLACITGGANAVFSVTGSVSESRANATVGTPYDNGLVAFTLTTGTVSFAVNDGFVFDTLTNGLQTDGQTWAVERWHGIGAQPVDYFASSQYGTSNAPDVACDGTLTTYWRTASGGQVNCHLGVEFSKPIDVRQVVIASYNGASFTSSNEAVKDFQIQYSDNGTAWTTDTAVTGQTAWQIGEYRSFNLSGSAGAHRFWRITITANNGNTSTTLVHELKLFDGNGLANVAQVGDGPELIVRGPGYSGSDQIYCGVRAYRHQAKDWYNWDLMGMTGFSASLDFWNQPGNPGNTRNPAVCWLAQPFRYWIVASGRRFLVFGHIDAGYEGCYLGFLLPYATPSQYPYPLFIGGTLSGNGVDAYPNTYLHRTLDNVDHRLFVDPGVWRPGNAAEALQPGAARLRLPSGGWKTARNRAYGTTGGPSATASYTDSTSALAVHPWLSNLSTSTGASASYADSLEPQGNGQYPLIPAILADYENGSSYGEMDGVKFVTGYGNAAETLVTVGSESWIVFTHLNKVGNHAFFAVRLA